MKSLLMSDGIWRTLSNAARKNAGTAAVAVAYFGRNASRMLPLRAGSKLVVDASETAVKSGQTCPEELLALIKKGVAIYSVQNLHAKVYVFGRKAYVGSANVSTHSAGTLIEAMILVTSAGAVGTAKRFVTRLCRHRLTPEQLKALSRLYRPPKGFARPVHPRKPGPAVPQLPALSIVNLRLTDWPERIQREYDQGLEDAEERRAHPRSYELDDFWWSGKCAITRGTKVMTITDEGGKKKLVAPPGNVLHVRRYTSKRGKGAIVYFERPCQRRRHLEAFARALGRGAGRRLKRGGPVNRVFADQVMAVWEK